MYYVVLIELPMHAFASIDVCIQIAYLYVMLHGIGHSRTDSFIEIYCQYVMLYEIGHACLCEDRCFIEMADKC